MCLYVRVVERWKTRDAIGRTTDRSFMIEDTSFTLYRATKRASRYKRFFFMLCLW